MGRSYQTVEDTGGAQTASPVFTVKTVMIHIKNNKPFYYEGKLVSLEKGQKHIALSFYTKRGVTFKQVYNKIKGSEEYSFDLNGLEYNEKCLPIESLKEFLKPENNQKIVFVHSALWLDCSYSASAVISSFSLRYVAEMFRKSQICYDKTVR